MTNVSTADEQIVHLRLVGALEELFGYDKQQYANMTSSEVLATLDALQLSAVYEFLGV